ncbi:adenine nucleotide alpha hydrolase [Vallitalea longa]|uniref:Adenine nucleotide alpha hydrolase n=1 Tax=Vallitalea longa TaxID=2936439 RepID=A0A9W6DEN7_9FIRM|nr:adenine nucleotide alpha hydrolase [Vallitalea longa]
MDKYNTLIDYLKKLEKVIIAFSGGVDSTFLLYATKEALGDNVKAVTINSPYIANWEIEEAKEFTQELEIKHDFIEVDIVEAIKYNPINRCYLCKKHIFQMIKGKAENEGYKYVIDGTNFDDTKDYRPGMKALKELEIVSPLLECEITKSDIRGMAKTKQLDVWNKPSYACLLTRIPHDKNIEVETLNKIEKAEKYLMDRGMRACRVRVHENLARIELDKDGIDKIVAQEIREDITNYFKKIGFDYITLDLQGYKMGNFSINDLKVSDSIE